MTCLLCDSEVVDPNDKDEDWDVSGLCYYCEGHALDQAAIEAWENVLDSVDWARYDAEIVSQKGQT